MTTISTRQSRLLFFLSLLLFAMFSTQAQEANVQVFSFEKYGEKIEFIKFDSDTTTVKPTLIFCQGSLPIPLIIRLENGEDFLPSLSNFDYVKLSWKYHIIVISPPFTPLRASVTELNKQSAYVTNRDDERSYSQDYLDANYLKKYVERGDAVIDYLLKKKWVDADRLAIVGHSQGAKVATKIASENKLISALGFLSGNPLGRVDEFVRKSRLKALKGIISHEEAQQEIDRTYKWWEWQLDHIDEPSKRGEDSPLTIVSFSIPVIYDLVGLKAPLYIAYGTEDVSASSCDLLPLSFIGLKKLNYKMTPYQGLDHNFMEVNASGEVDVDKCHWNKVMTDFSNWLDEQLK